MEGVIAKTKGEVDQVRAMPGCERAGVQIDSGAIDAVGPEEIAKVFEIKETEMSKRGIGYAAASGGSVKDYEEKKIVGHTEDGKSSSMRVQHADICSVRKMNLGGGVVVLEGGRSHGQSK